MGASIKNANNEVENVPKNFSTLRAEMHAQVIAKAIKDSKSVQADEARRAIEFFMGEGKEELGALSTVGVSRLKWSIIKLRYKHKRSQKRR